MPLIHLTCIQHCLVLLLFLLQKFLLCPGAHFGIGRKPLLSFKRGLFDVKESCSCTLKTHNQFFLQKWKSLCKFCDIIMKMISVDDILVYSSTAGISDWLCFFFMDEWGWMRIKHIFWSYSYLCQASWLLGYKHKCKHTSTKNHLD